MKLLAHQSTNAKGKKNAQFDKYDSHIMYLLPSLDLCPMSDVARCREACLNTAGRGAMNSVQQARLRKTEYFQNNQDKFIEQLHDELHKINKRCYKLGKSPAVRLNGTSDIPWELYGIPQAFPDIQFYDYTKLPTRRTPDNYHLTVSYSEANSKYASKVRKTTRNIAAVFRHTLPLYYLGREVIDGDKHDLRFLDKQNVVVGLLAKGKAKQDTTGFVIDL